MKKRNSKSTIILIPVLLIVLLVGVYLLFTRFQSTPNSDNPSVITDVILQDENPEPNGSVPFDGNQETPDRAPETETPSDTPGSDENSDTQITKITLTAFGDDLIHMGVAETGHMADGSYDFSFLFDGDVADYIKDADISIINQETIFGGNERGFSGYPLFNSRTEIGDAIADAGFDVVLHASNHAADQGTSGMEACARYWDEKHPEIVVTGVHAEKREVPYSLIERSGITFAILNYTYGPNMESFPSSFEEHMDILCAYNEASRIIDFTTLNPDVITDIEEADKIADIVIVCPHWGTEYTMEPSTYQQNFAKEITAAGADLIIGTHPHVVQPVEQIIAENGNTSLCYYSLGNFVSTQKIAKCMLEGMAKVTFIVNSDGTASIDLKESGMIPLVCHYTANPVRIDDIYLLKNYTEEQALTHGIRIYGQVDFPYDSLFTWTEKVFGDYLLEE